MTSTYVAFRRPDPSRPWGFRIQGGLDFGQPITIISVTPNGLAERNGVRAGDRLVRIGGDVTARMTHQQAQQAVIRCGNEIDFDLMRGAVPASATIPFNFNQASPIPDYSAMTNSVKHENSQMFNVPGGRVIKSSTVVNISSAGSNKTRINPPASETRPVYVPVKPVDTYKPQPSSNYVSPSLKYAMDNPQSHAFSNTHNPNVKPYTPGNNFTNDSDIKPLFDYMNMSKPSDHNNSNFGHSDHSPSVFKPKAAPIPVVASMPKAAPPKINLPKQGGGTPRTGRINDGNATTANNTKPICHDCQIDIRGPFLAALEFCFCPGHFKCKICSADLSTQEFIEQDGHFYCERDFATYLAPKCAACSQPVIGTVITAIEKKWHAACFVCSHCKKQIGEDRFRVGEDSVILCEKDWEEMYQINCDKCHKPIQEIDRFLEAFGKSFHAQCFQCAACNCPLEGKKFHARDGKAFCKAHAHAVAIFS